MSIDAERLISILDDIAERHRALTRELPECEQENALAALIDGEEKVKAAAVVALMAFTTTSVANRERVLRILGASEWIDPETLDFLPAWWGSRE